MIKFFRDFFKSPAELEAEHQKLVVEGNAGPISDLVLMAALKLRRGMWVVLGNTVGVLTEVNTDGHAKVAIANSDGTNLMQVECNARDLKQANIHHIPVQRRQHLSDHELMAMGYTKAK